MNHIDSRLDKAYVLIHPVHEKQRLLRWQAWLDKFAGSAEVFNSIWYNELSNEAIQHYYVRDHNIEARELAYNRNSIYPISDKYISLTISWFKLLEHVRACNYQKVLVFESDAYFNATFETKLANALDLLDCLNDDEWDILSLSDGGIRAHTKTHENAVMPGIYKMNNTRNLDAAIFNKSAIRKILQLAPTFTLPMDLHIRELIWQKQLNMWWLEPTICSQVDFPPQHAPSVGIPNPA